MNNNTNTDGIRIIDIDKTGTSIHNKILNEIHKQTEHNVAVNDKKIMVIIPKHGYFYDNSLVVTNTKLNIELKLGRDFEIIGGATHLTYATGKEISYIIIIKDPSFQTDYSITYQAYGDLPTLYDNETVKQLKNYVMNDSLDYKNLIGVPKFGKPLPHVHLLNDTVGYENLITMLEQIRIAILTPGLESGLRWQNLISEALNKLRTLDTEQQKLTSKVDAYSSNQPDNYQVPAILKNGGETLGPIVIKSERTNTPPELTMSNSSSDLKKNFKIVFQSDSDRSNASYINVRRRENGTWEYGLWSRPSPNSPVKCTHLFKSDGTIETSTHHTLSNGDIYSIKDGFSRKINVARSTSGFLQEEVVIIGGSNKHGDGLRFIGRVDSSKNYTYNSMRFFTENASSNNALSPSDVYGIIQPTLHKESGKATIDFYLSKNNNNNSGTDRLGGSTSHTFIHDGDIRTRMFGELSKYVFGRHNKIPSNKSLDEMKKPGTYYNNELNSHPSYPEKEKGVLMVFEWQHNFVLQMYIAHTGNTYTRQNDNAGFSDWHNPVRDNEKRLNPKKIIVQGDADTYYPVMIGYNGDVTNSAYRTYSVSRVYSGRAPTTWNTSTHKGALNFTFNWTGDTAWGGGDRNIQVIKFHENYSTMVAKFGIFNGGFCIWLRGGDAEYYIANPVGEDLSTHIYYVSTLNNQQTFSPMAYPVSGGAIWDNKYIKKENSHLYPKMIYSELNTKIEKNINGTNLGGSDLNTINELGTYYNVSNAWAREDKNYPTPQAGTLFVVPSAYERQQIYVPYGGNIIYRRTGYHDNKYGNWVPIGGNFTKVISGYLAHGSIIPLPTGYTSAQCNVLTSIRSDRSTGSWDIFQRGRYQHYVQECWHVAHGSSFKLHCRVYHGGQGGATGWRSALGNFLIIGVK